MHFSRSRRINIIFKSLFFFFIAIKLLDFTIDLVVLDRFN